MVRWVFGVVCVGSLLMGMEAKAQVSYNYPECAVYDPATERYFISNEGNGDIVQIDADGQATYYNRDLPLSVGMTVYHDTLYVCAAPNVVGFDLSTDELVVTIPVPGSTRLNDVCADSSGNLWISDPQGSQVFKITLAGGTSELVATGLPWVNGVHYDVAHHRVLLNQWIINSPIKAIDPDDYTVSTVVSTTLDNLNGFAEDNDGNIYVSAWGPAEPYANGEIYRYDSEFSGPPVLFSSGHAGAGDMCYNLQTTIMAVPNVRGQYVEFIIDPFADVDGDGILTGNDNCPFAPNPGQEDDDTDNVGNPCDNCPNSFNPQQGDIDGDGIGDECEVNRSWYVHPEGTGDAPTIQAAIDISTHGDTVVVLDGTYTGAGNRDLELGGRLHLLVKSANGPQSTIIDCEGTDIDRRRGFTFTGGEDETVVIDGFTIRNGYGPTVDGNPTGGGMLLYFSSPTIKNCVFTNNYAVLGGAVFARETDSRFINCTFAGNEGQYGAALSATFYGNYNLENCIVAFNEPGAAVFCYASGSAALSCCDVYGNVGGDWTGCISSQAAIDGNFSTDPGFCNLSISDVGLSSEDSPCAPAHNSCGALVGALDVGCACNCALHCDLNLDGGINPVDVVYIANFVYRNLDGRLPNEMCPESNGDWNCDGLVNPVDVVYYSNFVYRSSGVNPCNPCIMGL